MRQVHELDPSLTTVIGNDDTGWWVEVTATVNLRCVFGEEHSIDIHAFRQVGRHTDDLVLTAFEWAIRGQKQAILQLTMTIIDDEIQESFVDPCLARSS
jgi:hypothetical protein